ncbi:MAG TPA: DoxX family membrane protein [Thermoanaerobaculia bacterium]|nr:DoxX family membrane protein [Thermoanaerobaculia bacterium]
MNTALFSGLERFRDFGLLVLRLGLGVAFILHGYPKMFGGPEKWQAVGKVTEIVGIHLYPAAFGFAAAFAEFGGGILLILGLFSRLAAFLMCCTMVMATTMHLHRGDGFGDWSHAFELACVFFALIFVGPGKLSIDGK